MKSIYSKIKKCRNCKSTKLIKLFSLGNLNFTGKFSKKNTNIKKGPINLIMCSKCKLIQLANKFNLRYLYGPDYGYKTSVNLTMKSHMKKMAKNLSIKTKLKKKDQVLDIASNDGTLLNFYKPGTITFGMDPILKKYIKNYKNITFKINDFFSGQKVKNKTVKKFKIITALSVFYDLENPNKFLKDVYSILSDDGIFVLEYADIASILKYKMFDTICHEHLEYYSSNVLKEMCEINKLRIFDIKNNDINGASCQYYICKKNSNYKNNKKNLDRVYYKEKKMKLDKKQTYLNFFTEIKSIRKKTVNFLNNVKEKNKSIHCYGASTKGNVLLQYYKINNKVVDFVADRNPKKYNLYTPGTKIKIISEKQSRSLKPDYYLVLPWHFKKEILLREKMTRKQNSKFIFPLPKLKIYS